MRVAVIGYENRIQPKGAIPLPGFRFMPLSALSGFGFRLEANGWLDLRNPEFAGVFNPGIIMSRQPVGMDS
jgi:hypothetical protein